MPPLVVTHCCPLDNMTCLASHEPSPLESDGIMSLDTHRGWRGTGLDRPLVGQTTNAGHSVSPYPILSVVDITSILTRADVSM